MRTQFEVWDCDFPKKGVHPCVLISHPDRCARAEVINVLYCTSQRQSRRPYPFEVMLDVEDGMNWETFCDCSILWSVEVARLAVTILSPRRHGSVRQQCQVMPDTRRNCHYVR